jgi:hypothetical protein
MLRGERLVPRLRHSRESGNPVFITLTTIDSNN